MTAGVTLDSARYKDASRQALFVQDLVSRLYDVFPVPSPLPRLPTCRQPGPASVNFCT